MKYTKNEVLTFMNKENYPRSSHYDPDWIIQNSVGAHSLWLMESLTQIVTLKPGMRVLDIGCGKAISSVFLAKEFGVQVWAIDLMQDVNENYKRIKEMNLENQVFPMKADARNLPFADSFFDVILGVNSLQFFATEESYLKENLVRLAAPGGEIGMIVPGLYHEFKDGIIPDYLKPHVQSWLKEFSFWHSPQWWKAHFELAGNTKVQLVDTLPGKDGNTIYGDSIKVFFGHDEDEFYNSDNGRNITFVRIKAIRNPDDSCGG